MFKKVLVAVTAMVMMAISMQADTATVNGIEWTYTVSGGEASIYNDWYSAIPKTTTGAITIPSSLGGYPVTSIGDYAFFGCWDLTSVTIPQGVTSIGDSAFNECSGLTSITIPDSVTSIGVQAFQECVRIKSVFIPASVLYIGEMAFLGCGLADFNISPNNPNYKFLSGALLSKDGKRLIQGTSKVEVIPDGVVYIDDYAFTYISVDKLVIPASVVSIGDAFDESEISSFYVSPDNVNYTSTNGLLLSKDGRTLIAGINGNVVIPQGVTSIGNHAFSDCDGLTSVTIPDSVTSIGKYAFFYCSGLTSVTIPDSVTSIGNDMFAYCRNLTSVTIGSGVASIGSGAFRNCDLLKSAIFLGDAPRNVVDDIFYNCADDFTIKVKKGTKGWNGDYTSTELPETWYGYPIEYATESELNLTYKVVFNANGGSGSMAAQTIACNTWTKLRANAFKRTGYTFQGWAKSKTGAVAYRNGVSVKNLASSGTVTLYAVWKPNTYKVAFYANGGKGSMSAQSMTYNNAAYLKNNAFKRTGYTFLGWAKSPTGAVVYKNAAAVKNLSASGATIKLYAKWAKTKYKVAFYANGGKGKMSTQTFTYGKAAKLKKNAFRRTGYTFLGWAKSATGSVVYTNGKVVKNLSTSGATIKLYAKWAKTKYKIAFYANGGKGSMSAQSMTYNKAAYLKKNTFKRTGYTFQGWAKSAKGAVVYKNGKAVKNLRSTAGTVKLYAKWKPITYKIAFNANGGKGSMATKGVTYNKAAYLSKNAFKRSGYIFLGWSKTKTGAVAYKNAQAVKNLRSTAGIITLYAKWAKPSYKVAFYANGGSGSMSAQAMTYNKAAYLKKNAFRRTGYTFLGWAKSATGSVVYTNGKVVKNLTTTGGTVKLYAVWMPTTYKIYFYANGGSGSMSAQTMTYNKSAYLKKNAFTRSGYTFKGWARSSTGSVVYADGQSVKNLTTTGGTIKLYAVWKPYSSKNGVQLWEDGPYWAETNIGAENPEDYGYYFWWGDTIGYNRVNDKLVASDGSSSNFSFYDYNTPTYDKFNSELQSEGWITSNGVLAPEHDAARAHWGSNWRMPTYSELQALCDNCTWTWTKKNGVNGYVVSGKGAYSGASIFLPAAGYDRGSSLYSAGSRGIYWSSVPNSDSGYCSWYLYFGSSYPSMDYYYRGSGHPVRPVSDVH